MYSYHVHVAIDRISDLKFSRMGLYVVQHTLPSLLLHLRIKQESQISIHYSVQGRS